MWANSDSKSQLSPLLADSKSVSTLLLSNTLPITTSELSSLLRTYLVFHASLRRLTLVNHPASPPCPGSYSRQFRSHRIGLTAGTWFASGFLYQINFYRYDTRNFLFLFRLIDLGILWLLWLTRPSMYRILGPISIRLMRPVY